VVRLDGDDVGKRTYLIVFSGLSQQTAVCSIEMTRCLDSTEEVKSRSSSARTVALSKSSLPSMLQSIQEGTLVIS
jgi:hypothetical protein